MDAVTNQAGVYKGHEINIYTRDAERFYFKDIVVEKRNQIHDRNGQK